jgi:trigger factor
MASKVEKIENSTATVTVSASKKEWLAAQEKAFQKIKSKLKLKGFRSGNAIPDDLARPHIKQEEIYNEAVNVVLPGLYEEVLKENNLVPFMQPSVNVTKVTKTIFEATFEIVLYPEVTLGEYKGIKVELESVSVEDKEVENSIKLLLNKHADLVLAEEGYKAAKGDTVILDFAGSVDGVAFEGGTAENYELELGSNTFIPGFEDQLVGAEAGAEIDVNVTFPENYVKNLAGKAAVFKCKVHEIKTKTYPELNDEFVKELNIENVDNVEALRAHQKEDLLGKKERAAKGRQFNTLITKIVENATVSIGEKVIEREIAGMFEDFKARLQQNGLGVEEYLSFTGNTIENVNAQMRTEAVKNLSTFLVLAKIAEVENIRITDADVDNELSVMAQQYNMTVEKIKELLGENIGRVRSDIQNKKIEEFLKANNL